MKEKIKKKNKRTLNLEYNVQNSPLKSHYSKGITLIALVITIVILLILAGITITMLFGENGIIKKAQEAADMSENAIETEEYEMNRLLEQILQENSSLTPNEYGFYFSVPYSVELEDCKISLVFNKNGSVETYSNNILVGVSGEGMVTYKNNEIIIEGVSCTILNNGLTLILPKTMSEDAFGVAKDIEFVCAFEEYHDIYLGESYYCDGLGFLYFGDDGSLNLNEVGELFTSGTLTYKNHIVVKDSRAFLVVSMDGKELYSIDEDGSTSLLCVLKPNKFIEISDIKVVENSDGTGDNIEEKSINDINKKLYITFTAKLEGGEITSIKTDNEEITIPYEINDNGTYTFSITGKIGSNTYTAQQDIIVNQYIIEPGIFVEYVVSYKDAYKGYDYTTKNAWRLIDYSKNADGSLSDVKLISTGMPAKLYYNSSDTSTNKSWWITDNEKIEKFKTLLGNNYNFYKGPKEYYSIQAAAGLYYNFENINFAYSTESRGSNLGYFTSITNGNITYDGKNRVSVTGKDLFKARSDVLVRLLTLPELNKALKNTNIYREDGFRDETGLYQLSELENIMGNSYDYSEYSGGPSIKWWLASPYTDSNYNGFLSYVGSEGYQKAYLGSAPYLHDSTDNYIRPVICFSTNIRLVDTNNDGVVEIQ